jgi:hypothetical protein
MAGQWWKRSSDGEVQQGNESNKPGEEFDPNKFQEAVQTSVKTQMEEFYKKSEEANKPVHDFIGTLQKEREERAAKAKAEQEKKAREDNAVTDEDFLLDPTAAVSRALDPTKRALLTVAAKQLRSEVLGEMDYYHGDIKAKVDEILGNQTLAAQNDPSILRNTYKIVMFDHQKDIQDGKIKARNMSGVFQSDGTGGHSGKGKGEDQMDELSADEKFAAKQMGISEKAWQESKKELVYV